MRTNIYITNRETQLSYQNQGLILKYGNLIEKIPIKNVASLQIFADLVLDTKVVRAVLKYHIPVYFIARRGKYLGKVSNLQNMAIENRLYQYQAHFDESKKIQIAQKIIAGKIHNSLQMLYRWRRLRNYALTEEIKQIDQVKDLILSTTKLDILRGYEGIVAKYYFQGLGKTLPAPFNFKVRSRQPPLDPTNSMLSFGYTLLANSIMTALETNGLDAYVGFVHASVRNNPALVLDLMEEFRSIVVDHIVVSLIASHKVTATDFEYVKAKSAYPVLMNEVAKRELIQAYEKRLQVSLNYDNRTEPIAKIFNYQVQKLKKALKTDLDYQPFSFR